MAPKCEQVSAGQSAGPDRVCCYRDGPEGDIDAMVWKTSPVTDILYPYQLEILIEPLFWRTR